MNSEMNPRGRGTILRVSKTPWDVRIVAFFLFFVTLAHVPLGVLFCARVVKLVGSYPVLFGTVVVADELWAGVYKLLTGVCWFYCGWGLMRGRKCAWWFAVVFFVYYLTDEALQFPRSPRDFAIGAAIQISLLAWLWFRKDYYLRGKNGVAS